MLFALGSLTVGQILSSIMVCTDMCGMLLDGEEALSQPSQMRLSKAGWSERTFGGGVGVRYETEEKVFKAQGKSMGKKQKV